MPDNLKPLRNESLTKIVTENLATEQRAPVDGKSGPRIDQHSKDSAKVVFDPFQVEDQIPRVQLYQRPSEKLTLEIHTAPYSKSRLGRFFKTLGKDYGVLLTGLISLVATVVIAIAANNISKQQAKSLEMQAAAEQAQARNGQEEVNVKFIEEFKKHLSELTLGDEEENLTKKRLAAITLAQYGDRALPALKMSLAVEQTDIREGAAVVVVQMLSDKTLRGTVLSKLGEYFDEDNASLRVGVLECYLTINTGLTTAEFDETRKKIVQYIDPAANYANKPNQQRVLLWAVKFLSYWPSRNSKDFLLAVASNSTCGDEPREGAINYLPAVTKNATDLTAEQRQEVSNALKSLSPSVTERLKINITAAIQSLQESVESK